MRKVSRVVKESLDDPMMDDTAASKKQKVIDAISKYSNEINKLLREYDSYVYLLVSDGECDWQSPDDCAEDLEDIFDEIRENELWAVLLDGMPPITDEEWQNVNYWYLELWENQDRENPSGQDELIETWKGNI